MSFILNVLRALIGMVPIVIIAGLVMWSFAFFYVRDKRRGKQWNRGPGELLGLVIIVGAVLTTVAMMSGINKIFPGFLDWVYE
jgi:hypothetical protein